MIILKNIKVLSFDADETLWDFKNVMKHSLKQVLTYLKEIDPIAHSLLTVDKMIKIRNNVAERHKGEILDLRKIRRIAFHETPTSINRTNDELADHLYEIYIKHRYDDIILYDDVLPTLNVLKEKYKLIILSNGNTYPEKCGLEGLFDVVIFAQDYGFAKPDSRIFDIALEKTLCKKNEIVHIGDSLKSDIKGANNSGIKSIWLNRNNEENTLKISADYEIESLSELLNIL